MEQRLFTVTGASNILGINRNAVYDLIKKGHLKGLKLGSLKIPYYELEDFMKRNLGKDFSDLDNVTDLSFSKEANHEDKFKRLS